MTTITITLPKQEKSRLARIASRFGLSLSELSRHVLAELSESIPLESIRDYEHPITLRTSLHRAMKDWKSGKVSSTL